MLRLLFSCCLALAVTARDPGYYFGGQYKGRCGKDGYYYVDEYTFAQCIGGKAIMQKCPGGTMNSPMSEETGYTKIMTIFCDVNMNGGYYISPEYKSNDKSVFQKEDEKMDYKHGDDYNKDGNMEEYAERMAKETAAAASAVDNEKMEEYNLDGNMEEYHEKMAKEEAEKKAKKMEYADGDMEDYNKDGNMEEYAERMAKEAAKKEKNSEYNLDGNMEEYAERMAKEAAKKVENSEYNLDGNMEEYAERMAQETAAAAAAAASKMEDDEYAPYKEVKHGMSDDYKKKYGNNQDYSKYMKNDGEYMKNGDEYMKNGDEYMKKDGEYMGGEYRNGNMNERRAQPAAADSMVKAESNKLGEKYMDEEYNKDGNMEDYEKFMAAQASAAAAASTQESAMPGIVPYMPFRVAPQLINAGANPAPIPELFMPPADGAQFKVQYYHPMHYHYYPYIAMPRPHHPQSIAPHAPAVSYHHQYSYQTPSASAPGEHTYHGGYYGYAKKSD